MILIRILLGILCIPLMLIAYVLQLLLRAIVVIGGKIVIIIAGLVFLGGAFVIFVELWGSGENIGSGIWMILGSFVVAALPYVAVYVIALLETFIQWVRGFVFGR